MGVQDPYRRGEREERGGKNKLREKKDVFFLSERESVRPITRETEREFPFILLLFQRLLLETVDGFSLFFLFGGRERDRRVFF
jgi:hypothetical protein